LYLWPEEIKKKMSENRKGKMTGVGNWNWRGDTVGYRALHEKIFLILKITNIAKGE
jgi:hypothetical protein